MTRDLRIIVGGFLGLLPAGGVTWDYLQYPLGFARLGCDVHYIEDTRLWPVYQKEATAERHCVPNLSHLQEVMDAFGFAERWAYRDAASGNCFGMSLEEVHRVCRSADIFLNVSCSTVMRDDYLRIPARVLIDSDPMFTQIQCETETSLTEGGGSLGELLAAHSHHFTFGENFGAPDCRMPSCGIRWEPTRQPICLSQWAAIDDWPSRDGLYTTVMNWSAAAPLEYAGERWGQKNVEFEKILDLPRDVPDLRLGVAVGQTRGVPFPREEATGCGWTVLDPAVCVPDWRRYRAFIAESRGECSVAKQTYVKACTGWFSCRSACYLAAGRPVVAQDTGWTRFLPHDTGLLAFRDRSEAAEALRRVESDWRVHSRSAREIAAAHFDSNVVLGELLGKLGA
jgi:hypothetical protein